MYDSFAPLLDDVEEEEPESDEFFFTCQTAIPAAIPATTRSATPAMIHLVVLLIAPFEPL
jgi:hypothetical protein